MEQINKSRYKSKKNYDRLRRLNTKRFKNINDLYIESVFTVSALKTLVSKIEKKDEEKIEIYAPSVKDKTVTIYRKKKDLCNLLQKRIRNKEYIQSLVFAVTLTEDYISESLMIVLLAYPKKLLISLKGNEKRDGEVSTVDLKELIEAESLNLFLIDRARKRVHDCLFANPKSYMAYFDSVMGFPLPEDLSAHFSEIKATRDLYVHGEGIANEIYIRKSGELARATIGSTVDVDEQYLKKSVSFMKRIFSSIYIGMLNKFGESNEIEIILRERVEGLNQ